MKGSSLYKSDKCDRDRALRYVGLPPHYLLGVNHSDQPTPAPLMVIYVLKGHTSIEFLCRVQVSTFDFSAHNERSAETSR